MTQAKNRLLADIHQLAAQLAARAGEFEAARRIPPDVVDMLGSIGLFRMFAPRSHDGLELDLPSGLEVIATLARIDGSLGWPADVAATPTGGWRVTGRWPFLSGCDYADWIFSVCVMTENGKPFRGITVPIKDWEIEDTWYVAGLVATGNHHAALKDVFVPDDHVVDIIGGVPHQNGPLYQSVFQFLPVLHAAVHVGIAEGALDDLIAMARSGRQQFRAVAAMQASEIFQYELDRTAAELRSVRAAFDAFAACDWQHALDGTLKSDEHHVEATQMGAWIAATAGRDVDECFRLGGGAAVYASSPLQRRLRDAHVAAQHAVVPQRHYAEGGRLLLGTADGGH